MKEDFLMYIHVNVEITNEKKKDLINDSFEKESFTKDVCESLAFSEERDQLVTIGYESFIKFSLRKTCKFLIRKPCKKK